MMGMYTEILVKADINLSTISEKDLAVINYLFGEGEKPNCLPNHTFFSLSRWELIGKSSSYYHHPKAINNFEDSYIFSRSDLKNYDSEIENFFNWFRPLTTAEEGHCIGYMWYEENSQPYLIFK